MSRVVVAGVGNRIMKDDSAGLRAVEAIRNDLAVLRIRPLICETDFMHCLDEITPDSFLIVVDAVKLGLEPGSIVSLPLKDIRIARGLLRTQHEHCLFDLLALFLPDIKGYLVGIEAADIDFGLELSNPLAERFDRICSNIIKEITVLCAPYI
jgi:hydrogenase maturation protease